MVRVTGLQKRFGTTVALAGVDLQVAKGECVGVIGPNGSGRSTLLKLLATLLPASSGSIEIDGIDVVRRPYAARRHLAYVGDSNLSGHGLSALEYLDFIVSARGVRLSRIAIDEALARAAVPADADVDRLSTGNRRRLSLAAAFLVKPHLLLLDDPFGALDPDARLEFTRWLSDLRNAGTTIVTALNDERDVRALCHRVLRLEVQPSGLHRLAVLPTPAAV
ncbi:MAG TPA: ATP-binding cassette domain-containing protein [Vicinamibacterales bacterium]|nr:ATP-binding cassette domain-containing protein [Vicinamibacterales bacterium]